jgi:hypothetical protein
MPVQVVIAVLVIAAALGLLRWGQVWNRYRGRRRITCPENQKPAGVIVDATHAAATGFAGAPQLRLSTCSRWPERRECGQQCINQIQTSPGDCLVRNILLKWYEDRQCASCGQSFAEIEWSRKPALLTPGGTTLEWIQVPADQLDEVLAASRPLCFACHMASTLVREHPELVVDRSARKS